MALPMLDDAVSLPHPASRVVTLPDATYLFQAKVLGSLAEHGTLDQVLTPDLLPLVVGWATEQVGLAAPGASATPGPVPRPYHRPR